MTKQNKPVSDVIAQTKLMKLLKKGDSESLNQIQNEYFYLIKYLLELFANKTAETISTLAYTKLIDRRKEIKDWESIILIIFEEIIKISPHHCSPEAIVDLTKNMNALKDIFLQVEKLDEADRPAIRMSLGSQTLRKMRKLNLTKLELETFREKLREGLINEGNKFAADLYDAIYKMVFLSITKS